MSSDDGLVRVESLTYFYETSGIFSRRRPNAAALHEVSFEVSNGEAFGVVGESGSGKSTLARIVVGLLAPTTGQVLFDGRDLRDHLKRDAKFFRSNVQIVFQDPYSSLNPRARVETILARPLKIHRYGGARRARIRELLSFVGLPERILRSYPSDLSGGQRQRVSIARALAVEPRLLVLDEPTSALDVSTQAQLLNLLMDLRRRLGLTYLFVSHDLALIAYFCDRTLVLKDGRRVELGAAEDVYYRPVHPYTTALMTVATSPKRRLRQTVSSIPPTGTRRRP